MAQLSQDRIIRKEVALGVVREIPPPLTHIGLSLAPFMSVESDDVIFSYVTPDVDGLAPARAEDAESEMATKDDTVGTGRASIVDWAIKDHYDPSDVTRYREFARLAELAAGGGSFPLTLGRMTEDFPGKIARDTRLRRRKLDNRIEWLVMEALFKGAITYNDNKIKFVVDYGRPGGQTDAAPAGALWSSTTSDPIGDIIAMQEYMRNTHGITSMNRAITSRKVVLSILNSDRFAARSGLAGATGSKPIDPRYLIDGWGEAAALAVLERATGVQFQVYDSVYRTRALGSTTTVNNRFTADDRILFMPSDNDLSELDDTLIGFGKTLTSPHPEGNFTSGFYEWERDTVDPWSHDRGTGIKAFPVFPHLETTYVMQVL